MRQEEGGEENGKKMETVKIGANEMEKERRKETDQKRKEVK